MPEPIKGYPVPNAPTIECGRVQILAINTSYHLPDVIVPEDMELAVKAGPGNAGVIFIGPTGPAALSQERVWPLLPNESITYRVNNAKSIYASGSAPGDYIYYSVEQRNL